MCRAAYCPTITPVLLLLAPFFSFSFFFSALFCFHLTHAITIVTIIVKAGKIIAHTVLAVLRRLLPPPDPLLPPPELEVDGVIVGVGVLVGVATPVAVDSDARDADVNGIPPT